MPNVALHGRITVPASTHRVIINGFLTGYISAGDYYVDSATVAEDYTQAVDNLHASITAVALVTDTSSANYGRVQVTLAAGTTLTWDTAGSGLEVRNLLGFTANLTSGGAPETFTGSEQAEYVWLPREPISRAMAPTGTVGVRVADAVGTLAPDGTMYGTSFFERRVNRFLLQLVEGRRTWIDDEVVVNESFEKFWQDVIRRFRQFRLVWDEANGVAFAAGQYGAFVASVALARGGEDAVKIHSEPWDERWDVLLDVVEAV